MWLKGDYTYILYRHIQFIFFFKSWTSWRRKSGKNNKQTNYKYAWKFQKSWSVRWQKKGFILKGGEMGQLPLNESEVRGRRGHSVKAAENYALQFLLLHCSLRPVWLLIAERKRQWERGSWRERRRDILGVRSALFALCLDVFGLMLITKTALALGWPTANPKQLKFLWRTELLLQIHKLE